MSNKRHSVAAVATAVVAGAALIGPVATPAQATAVDCTNFEPGEGHAGFDTMAPAQTLPAILDANAEVPLLVDVQRSGSCHNPGSAFVRVEALPWDGADSVQAFVQVLLFGFYPFTLADTTARVSDADYFSTAVSGLYDAQGQTIRGCGTFTIGRVVETRCTDWASLPVPLSTEAGAQTESADRVDELVGTDAGESITGFYGVDTIAGLGGADILSGGRGDDYLVGGDGADVL